MKTYHISIGNMNGQHNYKVKANDVKQAKAIAIKQHRELGRKKSTDKVYVTLAY